MRFTDSFSRLRTPLYGYWPFVKEFSHEETTREIISLPKVNSNLGYGRAWLLGALQSGLVVCYFQSFVYNRKLVTKYYLDNALLRDTLVSEAAIIPHLFAERIASLIWRAH